MAGWRTENYNSYFVIWDYVFVWLYITLDTPVFTDSSKSGLMPFPPNPILSNPIMTVLFKTSNKFKEEIYIKTIFLLSVAKEISLVKFRKC
jgi:hypothetical protein